MFQKYLGMIAIVAATVAFGSSQRVEAAFSITMQEFDLSGDIGSALVLSDLDNNNEIVFDGNFGSFYLERVSAFSNAPGNSSEALLSTISLTVRKRTWTGSGLRITTFDDGFTMPGQSGSELLLSNEMATSQMTSGGSTMYASALDSTWTSPVTLFTTGNAASGVSAVRGGPTFTMTSVLTIMVAPPPHPNAGGVSVVNVTGTTRAVLPEPASLAVWGLGLGVMALAGARRRAKKA